MCDGGPVPNAFYRVLYKEGFIFYDAPKFENQVEVMLEKFSPPSNLWNRPEAFITSLAIRRDGKIKRWRLFNSVLRPAPTDAEMIRTAIKLYDHWAGKLKLKEGK